MKKILFVSAFAALLLSACASHHAAHHRNMGLVGGEGGRGAPGSGSIAF